MKIKIWDFAYYIFGGSWLFSRKGSTVKPVEEWPGQAKWLTWDFKKNAWVVSEADRDIPF